MKNIILSIIIIMSIASCKQKEKEFTRIAGKLENIQTDSIYLIKDNYRKAIAVTNNEFSDTLNLNHASYLTLKMGNESTQIFLHPSDSLYVTVNGEQFDESVKYDGNSAAENNYLAADYLAEEQAMQDPKAFFSMDPVAFKQKLKELRDASNQLLDQSQSSAIFKEYQKKNNEARYLSALIQYPEAYQYFAGQPVNLPSDFTEEFETYDFENETDFINIPNYKELVLMRLSELIEGIAHSEGKETLIGKIQSQKIKDAFLKGMIYQITSTNPDSKAIQDLIVKHSKDQDLVKKAQNKYNTIQAILPGKPSPTFDYPDINGKHVKLEDLKGKLVYVDVWATWCGPCIREIPSLKQLEADYHGKPVQVVSISIDVKRDFEKWENMVKEKDLKGIQLFADNDWKSDFVQSYAIDGIPRFILIDQNGNILDSDAPRPSDPEIRTLIDANL